MLAQLACTDPFMPMLQASRYNPFNEGVHTSDPIFSTYVKWNGRTDMEHHFLRTDKIYRVMSAEIESCHTELVLQDISSGTILSEKYNSVQFEGMPTFIGYSHVIPEVGKRYDLIKIDTKACKMVKWNTSTVIGLENLGTNTWNVITKNSVYAVQILS